MGYVDFDYYTESYGGNSIPEDEFTKYEIRSRMQIDMYTFNRVKNAIKNVPDFVVPEEIKNAQCAVMDYIKQVDMNGGAVIASETVSKHSVTYAVKSFDEEVRGIVKGFLRGTSWTYLGRGAGIDPG